MEACEDCPRQPRLFGRIKICPNVNQTLFKTLIGDQTFSILNIILIGIKHLIKHCQTFCSFKQVWYHLATKHNMIDGQTKFDPVWSPNVLRLDRDLQKNT